MAGILLVVLHFTKLLQSYNPSSFSGKENEILQSLGKSHSLSLESMKLQIWKDAKVDS